MNPIVTSHPSLSVVHTRLLLAGGHCGGQSTSGTVWVTPHRNSFPAIPFPVANGAFKSLIHLVPGENIVQLEFRPASTYEFYTSVFVVTYVPLLQNPPLHLAIIVGSDTPGKYDDVPGCPEPPTVEAAAKRLRMAGYLWQAYTAAEMHAHGMKGRTFRLDEGWLPDTLTQVDTKRRSTAKVRVLRSKYSAKYIRDPAKAQQNKGKGGGGGAVKGLFDIAIEAIKDDPELAPRGGEKVHVAAMILDACWDVKKKLITGHAALGSENAGGIALAIFGSHSVFAWPGCLENVVPAFNDPRPVDTRHCGVDVEGKTYWMAANVGIGAFLHECGHLFGCPHQPSGVMLRDYTKLNRSFCVTEPGKNGPFGPRDECHWHRLDALRFLSHPSFALPDDANDRSELSVVAVQQGIQISTHSRLTLVELRKRGQDLPHTWLDLSPRPVSQHVLTMNYLREAVSPNLADVKVEIFAANGRKHTIDYGHVGELFTSRHDPTLGTILSSTKFGTMEAPKQRVALPWPVRCVRVHSGMALDGVEVFGYDGGPPALFGNRGGSPKEFVIGEGEVLAGFGFRYGGWVDAIQVLTNRRRGEMWGNANGGGPGEVIVPQGYRICGIWGEVGKWVFGMGIDYCAK